MIPPHNERERRVAGDDFEKRRLTVAKYTTVLSLYNIQHLYAHIKVLTTNKRTNLAMTTFFIRTSTFVSPRSTNLASHRSTYCTVLTGTGISVTDDASS
jgi:hypothetical protein